MSEFKLNLAEGLNGSSGPNKRLAIWNMYLLNHTIFENYHHYQIFDHIKVSGAEKISQKISLFLFRGWV